MKLPASCVRYSLAQSPSARREWVEIFGLSKPLEFFQSPSARREWVEISADYPDVYCYQSPSARREWVEIKYSSVAK